ncbi:MAG: 50S ribosomal protein L31 [Patescibacteria group bacterium]|nr:50S ribosomal protein L31 [Patescibacteria group bacterium]
MQKEIHPKYYNNAKVTCACGQVFAVGSTQEKISVEICAACHPFYTGQDKVIDTAGRVEKFKSRRAKATETAKPKKVKKTKSKTKTEKPAKKARVKADS